MKAHCLFEQSGTFKNEFIKLGVPAIDYDIINNYGETDIVIDLFKEIVGGVQGEKTIFDDIEPDDIVMAFFPCTRFSARTPLLARGESYQAQEWDDIKKIKYSKKIIEEVNTNYQLFCDLVLIALERNLKLIIENPYTQPHILTQFFPIKPKLVDKDRRNRGDSYKKPTQYFFINVEPKYNFIWEPQLEIQERVIEKIRTEGGRTRQELRSTITTEYANRFIREFIII